MTAATPSLDVTRLCQISGLSRATYYRYVGEDGDDAGDHAVQDAIQTICLRHKYYGYRRVTVSLRRLGMVVNAKKVLRLMREDNLLALRRKPFLVPPSGKPESFVIVPNLVRGLCPSAPIKSGWQISLMCIWPRLLLISLSSSMPSRAKPWGGPWNQASIHLSPWRLLIKHLFCANHHAAVSFIIQIAVCNMPVSLIANASANMM
jgi:HTH-like domain